MCGVNFVLKITLILRQTFMITNVKKRAQIEDHLKPLKHTVQVTAERDLVNR